MSNIRAANGEGIEELMAIGMALKNAKWVIEEQTDYNSNDLQIDEAINLIDKVINEEHGTP